MSTLDTPESALGAAVTLTITDGVAMVEIDQPGKSVNVLSEQVVQEMAAIIQRLESGADGARALVIASGKPGVWIAGADVEQLAEIRTAADGEALSRSGQALLNRLESLPIPAIAAIDGAALGGGLEIALACGYRIASDSPKTKLGLPEVQLGLLPGAGGTQRLPRLVGLANALDLMLTGKQLDGRRARKLGLVDEVTPAAILLDRSRKAALELADRKLVPKAGRRRGSPVWAENLPGARAVIFRKARKDVLDKTGGLYPAPPRILDVVEGGIDRPLQEGLALEAAAFGELTVTPEARSLTHVFFASTAAKNEPMLGESAEAREVGRVAIVGAGFMGAGIATVTAESGMRVRLKDVSPEAVARGMATTRSSVRKRAERRRLPEHEVVQIVDRIEGSHEYIGFGSTDLVIEAVFEDLDLKHRVLREIEAALPDDAVLGSNTSTIPIAELAIATSHPDRVIGLHFFSPVEKMPLVEIIVTESTAPWVAATCHAYAKRIGKTPIIVNDAPGFYVNRILGPYMNEAALLLEEGVAIEDVDAAMTAWGFPVGPITLYDEVGLDVAAKSGKILAEASGGRVAPSSVLASLLADDRKGRKNGRGFYRYKDGEKQGPDEDIYALLGSPARRHIPREEIQDRLALGMVNEAVRALDEGVLRSARDGDVGAVFGIGFPPFRGGPFWYLDSHGSARVVERLRALEATHGPRFAPAPLLVRKGAAGESFGAL
jgi:3-hydroxyacyl-CoA dehydrogenase/enoyl-CoA hydratase/3-hydroxybutyryl-CoA epimerase